MSKRSSAERIVLAALKETLQVFLNVVFYVLVIFVVVRASKYVYTAAYQIFGSVSVTQGEGHKEKITVADGESTMTVAKKLEKKGLIADKYTFYIRSKLTKQYMQPGTYTVSSSMDYDKIFSVLSGKESEDEK